VIYIYIPSLGVLSNIGPGFYSDVGRVLPPDTHARRPPGLVRARRSATVVMAWVWASSTNIFIENSFYFCPSALPVKQKLFLAETSFSRQATIFGRTIRGSPSSQLNNYIQPCDSPCFAANFSPLKKAFYTYKYNLSSAAENTQTHNLFFSYPPLLFSLLFCAMNILCIPSLWH